MTCGIPGVWALGQYHSFSTMQQCGTVTGPQLLQLQKVRVIVTVAKPREPMGRAVESGQLSQAVRVCTLVHPFSSAMTLNKSHKFLCVSIFSSAKWI
jgi:hypothetical protein